MLFVTVNNYFLVTTLLPIVGKKKKKKKLVNVRNTRKYEAPEPREIFSHANKRSCIAFICH